ncbi:hypothetical protein DEA8626_03138 [Defluviimonas aquaemixtae]|uniref:Glycosyltransferase 2-like domain-containing protein n=1 Tax=Albidovulum aquaemixtae TaxID=1542388 RepID=A0A2R8BL32_9RHOB|nr:glycosyltransferase family 2 protein [Defluviimonas aquaemixtae]SPH24089.1 hypothetical protein DEA8626_03138 [Defluviimonas aquaemixtae]
MSDANGSIGVIVVAFNSADVIIECVESLLAQAGGAPRVVVIDNASTDGTAAALRGWAADKGVVLEELAAGARPAADRAGKIDLVSSGVNRGFAGGVNIGLELLAAMPEIAHFWIINPDAFAEPDAARAILAAAARTPGYGLMGGRVLYVDPPGQVQIDGGRVNLWTGVSSNVNLRRDASISAPPKGEDLDFITGANMVASRAFYQAVGPMREDYFLYYEEADWALRRGDFPLVVAPDFIVRHYAGTAIGSPAPDRLASPFSFWFKYRSRMLFVRRFNPLGLPVAMAYATAKAAQLLGRRAYPQAFTLLRAVYGLGPPQSVRARLSPEAARIAFGRAAR